jgi:hypothetical protein
MACANCYAYKHYFVIGLPCINAETFLMLNGNLCLQHHFYLESHIVIALEFVRRNQQSERFGWLRD